MYSMGTSAFTNASWFALHVDFHYRSHFDRAELRAGDSRGNRNGFVQIFRLDEVVATELLLGLCERAVGHRRLAVADANRGRGRGLLEGGSALLLPGLGEVLGKGHVLLKDLLMGFLRKLLAVSLVAVN